jgi:uncharacterized protein (TIGR02757 family)
MNSLKARLDAEVLRRNTPEEICYERPDPILVARRQGDEWNALVCALFAYGSARAIVGFLDRLDFSLIDAEEGRIRDAFSGYYYRFQNSRDVAEFFVTLARLKRRASLESLFMAGYASESDVIAGIGNVIDAMRDINDYRSRGYEFLIGRRVLRPKGGSPLKRWLMFLRWMVRHDAVDMGLWKAVDPARLVMPLDTHTFNVSKKLGLLQRRTYDLQAAIELTETLRTMHPEDPLRYDFALYRIGQERQL